MRKVALGKTGLRTSVLGYGCAGLMRPPTQKERFALLQAAFDAGIRHFDTARYYGHGGSESVLGAFLSESRIRDQVTLTTKFGIDPPALGKSSLGKSLMSVARRLASLHPGIRRAMSGVAGRGVRMNCFDPEKARISLETSLRELKTDRIDLFLLHEADLDASKTPGLLEFLEDARTSGKIRAFGCASEPAPTLEIIAGAPVFASVVQVANGVGRWNLDSIPKDPDRFILTHGALKALPELDADRLRMKESELAGWLLGLSISKNPEGVTLFSSTRPDRIRANAEMVASLESMTESEWSEFQSVVEGCIDRSQASV